MRYTVVSAFIVFDVFPSVNMLFITSMPINTISGPYILDILEKFLLIIITF